MARSKRSAEKEKFWRRVVDEQRRGGLKIREFCQQKSLSEASFHSWRRALTDFGDSTQSNLPDSK